MGLERLPQQAPVCCGDEVHEASSPGGASASCARLGGFFYATYFHAYFGDTLYGKRLRNFIYGDRLGGVLYTTCFGKRLRGFLYGNRLGDFQHGDGLGGVLYTTCFCADRLGDFYAELRAFFYLDPGYCGAFHRARRWAPCSRQQKAAGGPSSGTRRRAFQRRASAG